MSAKKKDEATSMPLPSPTLSRTEEAALDLNERAAQIVKFLRQHSQEDVEAATEALRKLRVDTAELELQKLEALYLAKKREVAALTGQTIPPIETTRPVRRPSVASPDGSPGKRGRKPAEGAPTVETLCDALKDLGADSKRTALRKGPIAQKLGCSPGQWSKVIADGIASKRVHTNGEARPMTAYFLA